MSGKTFRYDGKWFSCLVPGCDYETKSLRHMKKHDYAHRHPGRAEALRREAVRRNQPKDFDALYTRG